MTPRAARVRSPLNLWPPHWLAARPLTILRSKKRQLVTGYEVQVEAEQAERPPQVFVAVRIHHIVKGHDIDAAAVSEAIRISEEKYCSVEAMLKHSAVGLEPGIYLGGYRAHARHADSGQ